ncbi:MAG TPA: YeeE/YedE family protein [Bacillales bacterium]|nr:YeeE/YedE family protein [Bacillales bacterium]
MSMHTTMNQSNKATETKPNLVSPQRLFVFGGGLAAILLTVVAINVAGWQQGILLWLGLLLGYTLFHARFGFTTGFRQLMSVGNGAAVRAHMIMLAAACTLFAPILSMGIGFFGTEPQGYVFPVGTSVVVGGFLFGIGMQLGSGCASGTLYHIGGGRTASFVTLFGFIIGSVLGAWHWAFWVQEMPHFPAVSLATSTGWGYFGAWIVSLLIFAAITIAVWVIQKKKQPPQLKPVPSASGWKRVVRGSWPLWVGAIVLAVLNALTLMFRGHPWGVTSAFALWGSQAAQSIGIDVTDWTYWQGAKAAQLNQSVFKDSTSVMDFGVILGAFVASAAAGLFKLPKLGGKVIAASMVGGILMGYGARIAFGCNIGAYFGGIASFSLHGYVWMVAALAGTFLSLSIRPLFGLSVPKPNDSFC